jgi:hypothetical protein
MLPVGYGQAEATSRLLLFAERDRKEVVTQEWKRPEISGAYQWETFYDAVTRRRPVSMPIDDIVHAIDVVATMARAERSGKTETVIV